MKSDFTYALVLLTGFIVMVTSHQYFPRVLEPLLALTRPGATLLILGTVFALYYHGYHITAFVMAIASVYLLNTMWTRWVRSDARRLELEIGRDLDRFNPAKSIDLQFANGSASFEAPQLLVKPWNPALLVYPPSSELLKEMTGA